MKAYAVISIVGGDAEVNTSATPFKGMSLLGRVGNWGAYLISGTAAQLTAINALPNVYGIATDSTKLDDVIASGVRTRLNTWLTARGYTTIPASWTYRQVVVAVARRMRATWNIEDNDVLDE